MIDLLLRSAADMADLSSSDPPLDSKQQRKLRQQQLQQKFRQEMEAKKLLQKQKTQQSNASAEPLPLQSKQGDGKFKGSCFSHEYKRFKPLPAGV